jgi:hypothetical protein
MDSTCPKAPEVRSAPTMGRHALSAHRRRTERILHVHVLHRAAQSYDADANAPLHAIDQCVLKEIRQPLPRVCALIWYNFLKLHKTHKLTPAMAAGIADKLWSIDDIVCASRGQRAEAPRCGIRGPLAGWFKVLDLKALWWPLRVSHQSARHRLQRSARRASQTSISA